MKEIKFRAWDKDDSRMYEVAKLDFWGDPDQASCDLAGLDEDGKLVELFDIYLDEVEIMQYTGLKDKNGKEIYEGDIVACGDGKVPTAIRWVQESSAFMAYNLKRNEYHLLDKYFDRFIGEVIGNIYENPELIPEVTHA